MRTDLSFNYEVASTPRAGGPPDISLEESILHLQFITNIVPTRITPTKDVTGDGEIGLAEALYILQNEASDDQ